jgi:hypothetical protein
MSDSKDDRVQKYIEKMAEAYCDRPRCAEMSRNDKSWHRTKAAYLAAAQELGPLFRAIGVSSSTRGLATNRAEEKNADWGDEDLWQAIGAVTAESKDEVERILQEEADVPGAET